METQIFKGIVKMFNDWPQREPSGEDPHLEDIKCRAETKLTVCFTVQLNLKLEQIAWRLLEYKFYAVSRCT